MRRQNAVRLRPSSFKKLPGQATINYAASLMSILLVGAERLLTLSVQRVHRFAFPGHVDSGLVEAWHRWSTAGSL